VATGEGIAVIAVIAVVAGDGGRELFWADRARRMAARCRPTPFRRVSSSWADPCMQDSKG